MSAVIKKKVDPETKKVQTMRIGPKIGDDDEVGQNIMGGPSASQNQPQRGNLSFDLLSFLQHKQSSLVEMVNRELQEIGVTVRNFL